MHIYFKKNKDFFFMADGIIITRSESYLCARAQAVNFNDLFPNLKAASSPLCQSSSVTDQSLFVLLFRIIPVQLQLSWAKGLLKLGTVLFTFWFHSISFHPIPQTLSVLSSVFSFYPFVFASDEKIAVIIGQVHMILITCQSLYLSPSFQALPLSQINELCLAFLISPKSFCLPMFLLPHCSWWILSLVLFFFMLLWPVLFHHQSHRIGSIVKALCCTAWALC